MNELFIMLQLMCDPQGSIYSISTDPTHLFISKAGGGFDTVIKLKDVHIIGDTITFNNGMMIAHNKQIQYLQYGNFSCWNRHVFNSKARSKEREYPIKG